MNLFWYFVMKLLESKNLPAQGDFTEVNYKIKEF